jgi:hypothetical protein
MHEAKSGIPLTLIEQMLSTIRQIVRDEIAIVIDNEGLSEHQLDDKIYSQAQAASESLLDDNLDDRISDYIDTNIGEMLDGRIKVIVE